MSKNKIYVGLDLATRNRVVFRSYEQPTEESHGKKYGAAIGPFRTMRAARFMASPAGWDNNPHCVTVTDAERITKDLARKQLADS